MIRIIKQFQDFNPEQLYAVLQLRQDVFIVEQKVPFRDIDDEDIKAWHFLFYQQDPFSVQGYLRLLFESNVITIGRVVTAQSHRGKGIAKKLINHVLKVCAQEHNGWGVRLDAQEHLVAFYQHLGFSVTGSVFFFKDDPIPHVPMIFTKN